MGILQEAGQQRARSDSLLHYPEARGPAATAAGPDAEAAEDRPPSDSGAAPLLLDKAAAPARTGRRLGAFVLAGVGYIATVTVVGLIVLQTLPFGTFGVDQQRSEPRVTASEAAAAPLPPREPDAARLALPAAPIPADDAAAPAIQPATQTVSAPDPTPIPVAAPASTDDAPAAAGESLPAGPEPAEAVPPAEPPPAAVAAAPPADVAAASPPPSPSQPPMPQAEIELLMRRGRQLLDVGDVVAARLFLEPLAGDGYGPAATLLGETHDPLYLGKLGARGIRPDPARAAAWYRKASADGDPEAADRLSRLLARFPQ